MEIDPRTNGVHSLVEALKAFQKFHDNPKDIFALKDTILRSYHALETLFKNILFLEDPALLLHEDVKVKKYLEGYRKWKKGEIAIVFDELRTANLVDTIDRLRQFSILGSLDTREYELFLDSVKKLAFYRNKLQHFALSANPDVIGRVLGNVLPRTIDVLNQFFSNPPINIRGHRFYARIPLIQELKQLWPEAPSIIELLRHHYDRLIQEAIKFFKGLIFKDQILKLKIEDHGKVGAPPYVPQLRLGGFLDFEYGRLSAFRFLGGGVTEEEMPYRAELRIGRPEFLGETRMDLGVAEGSLEFYAQILFDRPDGALFLPSAEEKIAVLRGLTVEVKILLKYKAEALGTSAHHDVRKLLEAQGQLNVSITAIPKGYESEDVELIGQYEADLNAENAPFRFHAFREPDGSLKIQSPYILEWNINTKGSLKFA